MRNIRQIAYYLILLTFALVLTSCNNSEKKSENIVSSSSSTPIPKVEPSLSTKVIAEKLNSPWDISFLPDKTLIFTESSGKIKTLVNGKISVVADLQNIKTDGEGGLLGLAVDSEFKTYRFIYACANVKLKDSFEVQVLRFK